MWNTDVVLRLRSKAVAFWGVSQGCLVKMLSCEQGTPACIQAQRV